MAKKSNNSPDEIDLTTFQWVSAGSLDALGVPGCGGCHPGGGGLEFDRDGKRYDARLKNSPELAETLDGDYFKSRWDKAGVVQADCFICHLPGYDFKERNKHLKLFNYQWATVAASGIGLVDGFVREGQEPRVTYNKRLFNDDGRVVLDLSYPPPSENCVFCHGLSDLKKRGFSWNDRLNHDVHNLRNLQCAHCHPGDEAHNFAKGNENISTVRDDLDNTMMTCKDCHDQGFMGAPRPSHLSIRPGHLDKLACEVCHIPGINRAAGEGFDVATGMVVNYPKLGAKKIGEVFTWQPRFQRDDNGKLWPVNPLLFAFFTNQDSDGIYYPLFAREIKNGYSRIKDRLKDKAPRRPELHTDEEIELMLSALSEGLKNNKRFKQIKPYYHKSGTKCVLDEKGKVLKARDDTWVAHTEGFNINHNVAPAKLALGADGCGDCHSDDAHMFKGTVVTGLFGDDGKPETIKSGRLFGCRPWIYQLNQLHQKYLTPYVSIIIAIIVFFLVLHYTGQGPKRVDLYEDTAEITRFNLVERWTHLFRMTSFIFLAFTGFIFFYNNVTLLEIFFDSPQSAVVFHWVVGIVFTAASLVSIFLWARDAGFKPYDMQWLKKRGGYLGGRHEEVPAGRLNAGQKIFFWLSALFSLIMAVTGIMLIFKSSLGLGTICVLSTIHGFFSILFIASIIAHAYLGTIANPGTWRALVDGKVGRKWAEKHHSEWFKEVSKKK
ncbi:MAG TPA: formate dehydrogenase subunit gamma [Desulfobacteraceae bacterium]|nr:formate dehydrogenase subunit gamma [Desulfobacteraceae bacterium]HPJ66555.1 formate dehydrogenase subunit gamma [Desulfobacteraceae bacterium]HPQ27479.1 formate dehydrogenase subunit gamma [Desulfobacteraceae bacterium]